MSKTQLLYYYEYFFQEKLSIKPPLYLLYALDKSFEHIQPVW